MMSDACDPNATSAPKERMKVMRFELWILKSFDRTNATRDYSSVNAAGR